MVDVFDLELDDYVRLNAFAGNDHIDATAVTRAVVSDLYLDGGADDDRIIGSNLAAVPDVIIGGTGSDRVTGGAGVDLFYEVTDDGSDANEVGEIDTLIESRDADFWLSDTGRCASTTRCCTIRIRRRGRDLRRHLRGRRAVRLDGGQPLRDLRLVRQRPARRLQGRRHLRARDVRAASISGRQFFDIHDTGASGIDTLIYKGSDSGDTIQLDTVYDPGQDEDQEFTGSRWTDYGNHGDGLIIGHFNPAISGYGGSNSTTKTH